MNKLGEIRIRLLRLTQYATPIIFVSTTLTTIKVFGWPLWTGLLVIPFLILIYWLDGKKVISGEFHFLNQKNEEWREAMEILHELRKGEK